MRTLLKFLAIVNLLLLIPAGAWATGNPPRLQASPYIADYLSRLDDLAVEDYLELSLYFSGVSETAFPAYQARFQAILQEAQKEFGGREPAAGLAEDLLEYAHDHWLEQYKEKETRLDTLLDAGIFNCVSSSVFYMILSRSLGMPAWGVRTVDHAFIRVAAGEQDYDVETTNKYGFNPGSKKNFIDEFGNVTGFNYVPPGHYTDRRDISPLQLLGLILQNRITFYSEQKQFAEAVGLAVDYWTLLGDSEAHEVVTNAFQNMWVVYNEGAAFGEGIAFYDRVIDSFDADERLVKSRANLIHNYLLVLIEAGETERAKQVLDEWALKGALETEDVNQLNTFIVVNQVQEVAAQSYHQAIALINEALTSYGADADLERLKDSYVHNIIVELIQQEKLDEAYTTANTYLATGDLGEADWRQLIVTIIQKQAYLYKDDFLKAAGIIKQGMDEVGELSALQQHYQAYLHNYEIDVHNRMVRLYNDKRYSEARQLLEQALGELPDSQRLQDDLAMVQQHLGS